MKKTNYQITIGYKAVINVYVKAESEEIAKRQALDTFKVARRFKGCELQDDNYKVDGILDMDRTWNMYDK